MPLRICVDARPLSRKKAGIARYINEILQAFQKSSDIEWVLVSHRKIEFDLPSHSPITIVWDKTWRNLPGTIWFILFAPKLAQKYNCDILWGTQHILPLSKPKNLTYCVTWHDMVYKILPHTMSFFNRLLTTLLCGHTLKIANQIIAVSKTTRFDLLRFYPTLPSNKITVVYEGKTNFAPKNSSANLSSPYLFALGSLEPRKNLIALIKVFEILNVKHPELKLILSGGDSWNRSKLLSTIQESPAHQSIILTGFVSDEDLPNYFRNASLFVFPSLYEGFGLPLLEAEGLCPVVANDIEIFRELSQGFENLHFCDFSRPPKQVADTLEKLMKTTKEPLRFAPEFDKIFSWKRTAEEIHNIFSTSMHKKNFYGI